MNHIKYVLRKYSKYQKNSICNTKRQNRVDLCELLKTNAQSQRNLLAFLVES